jgi:hypothetical protein
MSQKVLRIGSFNYTKSPINANSMNAKPPKRNNKKMQKYNDILEKICLNSLEIHKKVKIY